MRWQWVVTMNEEQKLHGEDLFRKAKKKGQKYVDNLLAGKVFNGSKCYEFPEHVKVIRHRNGIVTVKFSKEFPYPSLARDYVGFCDKNSEHKPAPPRPYSRPVARRRRAVQSPPCATGLPFDAEANGDSEPVQYLVTIDKDQVANVSATVGAIMQIKGVKTVELSLAKSEDGVRKQCGVVLAQLAQLLGCADKDWPGCGEATLDDSPDSSETVRSDGQEPP